MTAVPGSKPGTPSTAADCRTALLPIRMGSPAKWTRKGYSPASASGTSSESRSPAKRSGSESRKLASGPATPMSKSTERRIMGPLSRMKAPSVPTMEKYGGNGMKYGRETGTPCRRAVR